MSVENKSKVPPAEDGHFVVDLNLRTGSLSLNMNDANAGTSPLDAVRELISGLVRATIALGESKGMSGDDAARSVAKAVIAGTEEGVRRDRSDIRTVFADVS